MLTLINLNIYKRTRSGEPNARPKIEDEGRRKRREGEKGRKEREVGRGGTTEEKHSQLFICYCFLNIYVPKEREGG